MIRKPCPTWLRVWNNGLASGGNLELIPAVPQAVEITRVFANLGLKLSQHRILLWQEHP